MVSVKALRLVQLTDAVMRRPNPRKQRPDTGRRHCVLGYDGTYTDRQMVFVDCLRQEGTSRFSDGIMPVCSGRRHA